MGVSRELIESAKRFRRFESLQKAVAQPGSAGERAMTGARLGFSGLLRLDLDSSVFLESILEGNDLMPVRYFEMGQIASRPIGRINFDLGPQVGQGFATGFLVAPGLLLTNHHVLPSPEVARVASVTFDAEDGLDGLPKAPHVFKLNPHQGYLADKFLDFCFVAVAPHSTQGRPLSDFGYLRLHYATGKILRGEYATIIQHPKGRQKQVAARNNEILVYVYDRELKQSDARENDHIYYSTDTLPGSSGAPVFSDQWYVVALHRRGVPETRINAAGEAVIVRKDGASVQDNDSDDAIRFIANEGVRISRIVKRLDQLRRSGPAAQKMTASQIIEKIEATLAEPDAGPYSVPTAPMNRLSGGAGQENGELLEIVRRPLDTFADAPGFSEDFLGIKVRLPRLSPSLKKAAARRLDDPSSYILPFQHFSTVLHAGRRLPIFAAVNIDGGAFNSAKKPARPDWSYDPRVDESEQPDDSIFSTLVQRGHMGAREFMWWGDEGEAREADTHSFTLSNVCPQINKFNGSLEWYKLERLIVSTAKEKQQKVNCFMGPVFQADDPLYDNLRSEGSDAEWETGIRIPKKFWYVLVWRQGNRLKHRCFVLDQSDDIEKAGPLEFAFQAPATVAETDIAEVSRLAKLSFPDLRLDG